ncbi:hypothetical protein O7626_35670 [Micromonospora sp. WMMD1102]|uniref:hypothetical protein n=1 Tax=Micromonospora sp. WMMD1102 TaxID=3016105 RepID=UPI002415065D|nr:hypothetical protein [Micromonospora sp. WMMD1102]MDG4791180.1 hypothetical protein [Micromonospora sp. WMMD1102]
MTIAVAEQAQPWRHSTRTDTLDEVVCTVEALADTSTHWQRYAYRGAKVLLDRLDGGIAELTSSLQQAPTVGATAESFPLPDLWNAAFVPDRVGTASLRLFPAVETLACQHGHADVFEAWGSDIELIHAFVDTAVPGRS